MPAKRLPHTTVRFTPNFEDNLAQIEAYWDDNLPPTGYDRLLSELIDTTVPTLEQHPRLGRPFFNRAAQTQQAKTKELALRKKLTALAAEGEIREYVMTDYTVLYALIAESIYLLAIKHHKQLALSASVMLKGQAPKTRI
jgi:ParE toxin of type II toxin-antitoxin system, parDE